MKKIYTIFTICVLFCFQVEAAEIISSKADYKNHRFSIEISGSLKAKPERVLEVLTDYNHITKLSPKVIESRIVGQKDGGTIVKTIAKGCVWFFCQKIINSQLVIVSDTTINSTTLPQDSNLKFGKMRWEIKENQGGTLINYSAQIEPDFFVPPLIGAFFIKRSLLQEASDLVENVERLANE